MPLVDEVSTVKTDSTTPFEVCKAHDFPASLCPYCRDQKIAELEKEVERLKKGNFTEQERQNLCHNLSQDDVNNFGLGCFHYQVELFGPMQVRGLYLRVRTEYLRLFTCESCGSYPEDDGRMHHGRCCRYKPDEFEDVEDLVSRKTIAK